MISKDFEYKIVKTLGLESLDVGFHTIRDENGKAISQIPVKYIWAADVLSKHGVLSLAIIRFKDSHKLGLMKAPRDLDYYNDWRKDTELEFVTVNNWRHKLLDELNSFNLLPISSVVSMGDSNFECHITVVTTFMRGNFSLYGPVRDDDKISNFWTQLLGAIQEIEGLIKNTKS
jgi:hypothetical protein